MSIIYLLSNCCLTIIPYLTLCSNVDCLDSKANLNKTGLSSSTLDEVKVSTSACPHVLWILAVVEAARVPSIFVKPIHVCMYPELRQLVHATSSVV